MPASTPAGSITVEIQTATLAEEGHRPPADLKALRIDCAANFGARRDHEHIGAGSSSFTICESMVGSGDFIGRSR